VGAATAAFEVAAYVPEYRLGVDLDALASRTSTLMLFSLEVDSQARLIGFDRFPADVLARARAARAKHGTKLLISVGGGGRSSYMRSALASTIFSLRLAQSVSGWVAANDLDGVDVDWEDSKVDEKSFVRFIANLRSELPSRAIVTVALHVNDRMIPALAAVADRVHLMAYDLCTSVPCRHSTLQHAVSALDAAIAAGAEARKLVLGVPLYGRVLKTGEAVPFYDIVKKGPVRGDLDATNTINFNGRQTIAEKVDLVKQRGGAGIFFWEAGQDVQEADESLIAAAWAHVRAKDEL